MIIYFLLLFKYYISTDSVTSSIRYQLRFFHREEFACPCGLYPIESRRHILHECKRFNNYWNPRRDSIGHFTLFLEYNSNAFFFGEDSAVSTRIRPVQFCCLTVNNLLHDTQLQSVANSLQQVTYNFSLRRQKTSLISRERETLSKLIEIKKKSRQGLLTTNLLIIHLQVHKQTYHTENTE